MLKFAANLTMLFTEVPFIERFALAKEAGFSHVEYMSPYEFKASELKKQLTENGLTQVLFNLPSGNFAQGERGIAVNPERIDEFRAGVTKAIEYALALGVSQLNCLVGKRTDDCNDATQWSTLVNNIRYAAGLLQKKDLRLMIEPINHFDIPGFFLNRTDQVVKLINEVGLANVFVQYDVYHAQREEGELVSTIRKYLSHIGHIQVADNPGRHQPGTGEINYPFIFKEIEALGYQGYIGLEYVPDTDSKLSFDWVKEYGYKL
jgi:hydroxypyruvate isomerase